MNNLILVDSNILIYAINSRSSKHVQAQDFLQRNVKSLALAHQNILESMRVLTHERFANPMVPHDALLAIENISRNCTIISPDIEALRLAEAFIRKHSTAGNRIFDVYLAATAIASGVTKIATDNTKDFTRFGQLEIINPFH